MSEAISALKGRVSEGVTTVTDTGLRGMITVRFDPADTAASAALSRVIGAALPERRRVERAGDVTVVWMSPDELLIIVGYDEADAMLARISEALSGTVHLATNVSDARAVLSVEGPAAREAVAKGAPVDLSPGTFGIGEVRRSRLGQVAVAFWMTGDDAIELVCFRSVAGFVFDWLALATQDKATVGFY